MELNTSNFEIFKDVNHSNTIVQTSCGMVRGEKRGDVLLFRGIPYGEKCIRERRFLPPLPAVPWKGILDCTKNGHIAVQAGESISGSESLGDYFSGGHPEWFGVASEKQGEDCLVLNVVTPGTDDNKRPVVFYIHGGGFTTGSGSLVLGSDKWVLEEDLVVVGVNHRLNVLGFLYLGYLDDIYQDSGNAGLLDLVLALQWVQNNISAFGGDPDNVTIMGESGGGMKVSSLMAMKEAQGLFCKAIVESGSDIVGIRSISDAKETTAKILDALNLKETDYKKLLFMPVEEFRRILDMIEPLKIGPVGDGRILPAANSPDFKASSCSENIPLLIGNSLEETSLFIPLEEFEQVTFDNLAQYLLSAGNRNGSELSLLTADNVNQVITAYRKVFSKDSSRHIAAKILSGNSILGRGTWFQAVAKAEQPAQVFHYVIAYQTICPTQGGERYSWHTADLPLQMRIVRYKENELLSRRMAHSWASFIRTGSPETGELSWKPFTNEEPWTLIFDKGNICKLEKDPYGKLRKILGEHYTG